MIFNCCRGTRPQSSVEDISQQDQNSMKKFFGKRRQQSSKTKRKSGNSKGGQNSRNVNTLTAAEKAALAMSKLPKLPPLEDQLKSLVFEKDFVQAEKDILRLIRKVNVEVKSNGGVEESVRLCDEIIPDDQRKGAEFESVFLLSLLLEKLVEYFEEKSVAEGMVGKVKELMAEEKAPSVRQMVEACGGEKSRTSMVLRCMEQGVAITGHAHIKCSVCPFPTKDLKDGWFVYITLAEVVQVKHVRREVGYSGGWKLEFSVSMTFSTDMAEMNNSQLAITDLELPVDMDEETKDYLNQTFGRGSLVVC